MRYLFLLILLFFSCSKEKPKEELKRYYIFEMVLGPLPGETFQTNTIGDLITIYDKGSECFFPTLWLQTTNGYPGIYNIIDQGSYADFNAVTNYKLIDLNAFKYDMNIMNAEFNRNILDYNDYDEKNNTFKEYNKTVTANQDLFLKKIILNSYKQLYHVNLNHSTRIRTNELARVVSNVMKLKRIQ